MTLPNRFWVKVSKTATCWIWNAYKNHDGYGRFFIFGNARFARRLSFESVHGKVPAGKELDHLRKNRACVNPEHLEVVEHTTNVARGNVGYRKTWSHCLYGHEFSPETTYVHPQTGKRRCRICATEAMRHHREKQNAN